MIDVVIITTLCIIYITGYDEDTTKGANHDRKR